MSEVTSIGNGSINATSQTAYVAPTNISSSSTASSSDSATSTIQTQDTTELSADSQETEEPNPVNLEELTGSEETEEKQDSSVKEKQEEQIRQQKEQQLEQLQETMEKMRQEAEKLQQKFEEARNSGDIEAASEAVEQLSGIYDEMGKLMSDISSLREELYGDQANNSSSGQVPSENSSSASYDGGSSSPTSGGGYSPVSSDSGYSPSYSGGSGGDYSPVSSGVGYSPSSSGAGYTPTSSGSSSAPAAAVNAPTSANLKGDTAQEQIFNYLKDMGLTDIAAAGVMGNMKCESGYSATNLQNSYESKLGLNDEQYTQAVDSGSYSRDQFVNDSAGYGIVQYTYSGYKAGLYDMAKEQGKSVGDLGVQLEYLSTQMKPELIQKLNSASTPAEAATIFCNDFEKPGTPNMDARIAAANEAYSQYAQS